MEIDTSNISYNSGNESISGYLAYPKDGQKHPGIVLIHEIFGVDDHIKDVTERLAREGYTVLAPDLFSSEKFSGILTKEAIGKAMNFMMSIPVDKQRDEKYRQEAMSKLRDSDRNAIAAVYGILFINRPIDTFTGYLSSAVDFLTQHNGVNGKIGSVGFCFGGGMSINLGCTGKVDAAAIFYGENPEPISKLRGVRHAVLGLYGGEDTRITSKAHELVKELADAKKNVTIKVYKGAYHAFFNNTRPQTHNETAAKDAWQMLLRFYKENLQ